MFIKNKIVNCSNVIYSIKIAYFKCSLDIMLVLIIVKKNLTFVLFLVYPLFCEDYKNYTRRNKSSKLSKF